MSRRPAGLSRSEVLAHYGVVFSGEECVSPRNISGPQKNGYWHVHFAGQSTTLHRLILDEAFGEQPTEVQARHRCGHKWCVNARHVERGTVGDNMADQFRLGERVMNERHPLCRLSSADAISIRDASRSTSTKDLAARYGLSVSYVNQIRAGSRRRYLAQAA